MLWQNGALRFYNTTERVRIGPNGEIGLSGANYGTSGQVLTSNGSGSAPTWQAAGSVNNAGTLDGLDSSQFLRSDANDSASGVIDFLGGSSTTPAVRIKSAGNSWSEGLAIHPSADNGYALTFFRTTASLTTNTNTWAIGNLGVNSTNNFGLVRKDLTGGSGIRVDSIFDVTQSGTLRFGFNPTVGSNSIWHAGNDGSGSGLDADTVDGIQGASFLMSDATDNTSTNAKTRFGGSSITQQSGSDAVVQINGFSRIGALAMHRSANPTNGNGAPDADHEWLTNIGGVLRWGSNANTGDSKFWHAGNDGSGSGLDADTVDGIQATSFLRSDAADTATGTITISGLGNSLIAQHDVTNGNWSGRIISKNATSDCAAFLASYNGFPGLYAHNNALSAWHDVFINSHGTGAGQASVYLGTSYINGNIAWHAGNDGSGSGLDADTVDGLQASQFIRTDVSDEITKGSTWVLNHSISDWGFRFQNGNASSGRVNMCHGTHGMHIRNDSSTTATYLLDVYAANGNRFKVRGADAYTTINGNAVWHAGNDGSGSLLDADKLDGYDLSGTNGVSTKIFNNKGLIHSTNTNFNSAMNPGANYLQNGTNGPTGTSGHQWYGFMLGLGSEYGTTTGTSNHYATQLYWGRQSQTSNNPYLWARDLENGSWQSWRKFSAGDSDNLGGQSASAYLRSNANDDATGNYNFSDSGGSDDPVIHVKHTGSANGNYGGALLCENEYGNHSYGMVAEFRVGASGQDRPAISFSSGNSNTHIWGIGFVDNTTDHFRIRHGYGFRAGGWGNTRFSIHTDGTLYAGELTNKIWHAGNDGAGSLLDADTVDGIAASSFLRTDATGISTQRISFKANTTNNWDTIATGTGGLGSIEVRNDGAGNDAFMAFHAAGDYAIYFGLDADANELAVGGWSMGASKYKIWHAGNDGNGSGLDADTLDGLHNGSFLRTDATTTFNASGNDLNFDYDSNRTIWSVNRSGTRKLHLHTSGDTVKFSLSNSAKLNFVNGFSVGTDTHHKFVHIRQDSSTTKHQVLIQNRTNAVSTAGIAFIASGSDFSDGQYAAIECLSGGTGTTSQSLKFVTSASGGTPATALTIGSDGVVESGNFRAPSYYDSNDTGYYINPNAGGSQILELNVGNKSTSHRRTTLHSSGKLTVAYGDNTMHDVLYLKNNNITAAGHGARIMWHLGNNGTQRNGPRIEAYAASNYSTSDHADSELRFYTTDNNSHVHVLRLRNTGNAEVINNLYTPAVYDLNDSTYYLNPAGDSTINGLFLDSKFYFKDTLASNDDNRGIYFNGSSDTDYAIYVESGAWTSPFRDLVIGFHTGIKIGGHKNYGGTRFYNTEPFGSSAALVMEVANGNNNVRVVNTFTASGDSRAPIFYDSNDTNYYLDPTSTSDSALRIRGGALHGPNPTWGDYLLVGGDGRTNYYNNTTVASVCTTDGNLHIDAASGHNLYLNRYDGNVIYFGNGANATVAQMNNDGTFRSPIFYDFNNTAYYLDPHTTGTSLNVAGAIIAGGNVTAYSDIKFKENIKVIPDAVEKVKAMRGVTYTRNDLEDREVRHTGVIAQEVEQVLPEAVREGINGKTVAYGNMVGLLIEAIKEQQKQIDELKAKLL